MSTNGSAVPGTYNFTVQSVASYNQLISQGYSSEDSNLGDGSVTLTSNGNTTSIDTSGMTLQGLASAINNQSTVGVSAIVVSNGASTPTYSLMLSSQTLGSAGAMSLTSTLPESTAPVMQTLQAATDTVLNFGSSSSSSDSSGDGSFDVTRSGQTISDVIPGVTLAVNPSAVGQSVTVSVQPDTSTFSSDLQNFVAQYNNYVSFVAQQDTYDSTTNTSGTLLGQSLLTTALNDIDSTLNTPVTGLSSSMDAINQIGLSFDNSGNLDLDTTTLNNALASNPQAVEQLFATTATSANPDVTYVASADATQPSGSAGYDVNITQAATQSQLTLATALPTTLSSAETLTLNGTSIALSANMTQDAMLQAINNQTSNTGVTASLTGADGTGIGDYLTLTSANYGSHGQISLSTGQADDALGIGQAAVTIANPGANLSSTGQDVEGTINGQAATGSGQMLTSTAGASTGLILNISGTATGDLGAATFSQGLGTTLANLVTTFTDPNTGMIQSQSTALNNEIDNINTEITNMNTDITAETTREQDEFNIWSSR